VIEKRVGAHKSLPQARRWACGGSSTYKLSSLPPSLPPSLFEPHTCRLVRVVGRCGRRVRPTRPRAHRSPTTGRGGEWGEGGREDDEKGEKGGMNVLLIQSAHSQNRKLTLKSLSLHKLAPFHSSLPPSVPAPPYPESCESRPPHYTPCPATSRRSRSGPWRCRSCRPCCSGETPPPKREGGRESETDYLLGGNLAMKMMGGEKGGKAGGRHKTQGTEYVHSGGSPQRPPGMSPPSSPSPPVFGMCVNRCIPASISYSSFPPSLIFLKHQCYKQVYEQPSAPTFSLPPSFPPSLPPSLPPPPARPRFAWLFWGQ